ncbi:BTB/POZ domain-containing protein KCTD9 isoform X2 [Planococcus citri]|uniref:BTB/POZ domain-containing protein KCTD9 isoform X2 n=1 Tax=Planococcus citri TaxID=170843 RepID=UPI0031F79464
MKRVILFKNGCNDDGKVIPLTTFPELVAAATVKFGFEVKRIFTAEGGEIDNIEVLRDNELLYVSAGEPFVKEDKPGGHGEGSERDWITLNVGGVTFLTSRATLILKEPNSMLAKMFCSNDSGLVPSEKDSNGAYLLDRSPAYFEPIINYLRTSQIIINTDVNPLGVLEEARYFNIESMIPHLEAIAAKHSACRDTTPLSTRDVVDALISTDQNSKLRFQGVNLAGADLSRLDLRNINFKYACLQGCRLAGANLSNCILERADLSNAVLDGAQLLGVKMLCANLEGASLKGCNFEDPAGVNANMEGVNLKNANLEGSNMAGVHLRVATLKNANLQHCDLRAAVLAGADLENCDLSGSNLHETNLRGANLKGASLELMQTPVHMCQTVAN